MAEYDLEKMTVDMLANLEFESLRDTLDFY